ncbi:MAG: alpha-glucan family phosphorylase, partial [Candidatus Cloacimonetes bacterium]|nr:alpha-glucan family phosphorylase [Candidatus Cloacimonadota bacterium]
LDFPGQYFDDKGKSHIFGKDFHIAYFSMEYGLHESLPIYSGGLGVLSGDHLKAASDIGLPLTAFGLLYRYGYFSQKINLEGIQEEVYKENEWYSKPVQKIKNEDGSDLVIRLRIRNDDIFVKAWLIFIGKIPLYLLDADLHLNKEPYRRITDYLYDADKDTRILQEIVLAYGSFALMKNIGLEPKIYHLNEGHSAFLIIRRLNHLILEKKFTFAEASEIIRTSTVFTTHTPVPAGNEKFDPKLVEYYLGDEIKSIGMEFSEFANLAVVKGDQSFSLPALAIRFSNHINGVSELHSKVSKEMWHPIYPDLFEDEMPIKAITNGVHIQSWLSRRMIRLFDRYIGDEYRHNAQDRNIWENVISIPENEIWEAHQGRKEQMISFIRSQLKETLLHKGSSDSISKINDILHLDHLVIGFARRFASYKRAVLVLQDRDRLLRLIRNQQKPVQFLFAGKAHPADNNGKMMIKALIDFARENDIEKQFVFIEDFDMNIARHLVQGVDVWLNNPIKPLEASGTSGMKAGMNGALNLSILDGWWPECYNPDNGWAINSFESISNQMIRDKLEANEIYDLLENEIIPLYYERDQSGLPLGWITKMKHSIHDVVQNFNIHRTLKDYIDKSYLIGAQQLTELSADNYKNLHIILQKNQDIKTYWDKITIEEFNLSIQDGLVMHNGDEIQATTRVNIDGASQDLFAVEVFYQLGDGSYTIIPLDFVSREGNIAFYSGNFLIRGSGQQRINLRVKPVSCCCKNFSEYIKWYY